jgi:hypothetical protein
MMRFRGIATVLFVGTWLTHRADAASLPDISAGLTAHARMQWNVQGELAIGRPESWDVDLHMRSTGPICLFLRKPGGWYDEKSYADDVNVGLAPTCSVQFHRSPFDQLSQDRINAKFAEADYLERQRGIARSDIDPRSVKAFSSGPIVGQQLVIFRQSTPQGRGLMITLANAKVAADISCMASTARFAALKEEFYAVARGIVLPER